jgi:hypothetical protein
LLINNGNGQTVITGNINGGESVNAVGVFMNGTFNDKAVEPIIYGNIFGGIAGGAVGLGARGDRAQRPTIYGNISAGTAASGINLATNQTTSVINVYGNITANGAVACSQGGPLYVYGTVTASNNFYGAISTIAYVAGALINVAGNWAIFSPKLFVATDDTLQFTLNNQTPGDDILLYSANSFVGIPSGSDVRTGVVYGPSDDLTGTLAVPPSGSVALGVPVDNTVGTAIINVQDMGALLASYII